MIFDYFDYRALYSLFDAPDYAGYKPTVREAPNGDGVVDNEKRYLHVALKYNPPAFAIKYLARAHFEACRVAEALKVPDAFYPRVENGTLRVLEYPEGAGSAEHTDFDLFTVHCYRSDPQDFEILSEVDPRAAAVNTHCHIGQIGELVGLGEATRHRVPARPYRQFSIVYFAMPTGEALLPEGRTVNEWLADRYAKSRVYK